MKYLENKEIKNIIKKAKFMLFHPMQFFNKMRRKPPLRKEDKKKIGAKNGFSKLH